MNFYHLFIIQGINMIIKLIGSFMVFMGCTLYGFRYANVLSKRVNELRDLEKSVMILQNEITYTYTEIPEVFLKISKEIESNLYLVFKKAYDNLINNMCEDVFEAMEIALNEEENKLDLNKKDKNILLQLSKSLGQWDIEAHKNIFKLSMKNINDQIEEAMKKEKTDGKLIRTLGISLGAVICILLL